MKKEFLFLAAFMLFAASCRTVAPATQNAPGEPGDKVSGRSQGDPGSFNMLEDETVNRDPQVDEPPPPPPPNEDNEDKECDGDTPCNTRMSVPAYQTEISRKLSMNWCKYVPFAQDKTASVTYSASYRRPAGVVEGATNCVSAVTNDRPVIQELIFQPCWGEPIKVRADLLSASANVRDAACSHCAQPFDTTRTCKTPPYQTDSTLTGSGGASLSIRPELVQLAVAQLPDAIKNLLGNELLEDFSGFLGGCSPCTGSVTPRVNVKATRRHLESRPDTCSREDKSCWSENAVVTGGIHSMLECTLIPGPPVPLLDAKGLTIEVEVDAYGNKNMPRNWPERLPDPGCNVGLDPTIFKVTNNYKIKLLGFDAVSIECSTDDEGKDLECKIDENIINRIRRIKKELTEKGWKERWKEFQGQCQGMMKKIPELWRY